VTAPAADAKLDAFEAVRAVCAVIVLLNHALSVFAVPGVPPWLHWLAQFSTEAVLVFFLLSGAVITHSLQRRPRAALAFATDRLVRIYPVYAIAIALATVAVWVLAAPPQALSVWIANALFLQSWTGAPFALLEFNRPLWSLPYEMFYYGLVALLLLSRFGAVGLLLALTTAAWLLRSSPSAMYLLLLIGLAPAFFVGAAIVRWQQVLPRIPLWLAWIITALALALTKALEGQISELLRQNLFALTLAPLLLALYQSRPGAPRLLVYLGAISYALYAFHHPLYVIANSAMAAYPWSVRLALGVGATVLLAHLIERGLQPRIKAWARPRPVVLPSP
jgi:peptidoglycan/LPS O-acetylase OafA/YrhL